MASKQGPNIVGYEYIVKSKLEHHEKDIIRLMSPAKVVNALVTSRVIDETDRRNVMLPAKVADKNKMLIGMLPARGESAFGHYIRALKDSGIENNRQLARILTNEDPLPSAAVDGKFPDNRFYELETKVEKHEIRLDNMENIRDEIESLRLQLKRKEEEIEDLKERLKKSEEEKESLQTKFEEEREALQQKIRELEDEVRTLQNKLDDHEGKIKMLQEDREKDREELDTQAQKLEKLEAMFEKFQAAGAKNTTKPTTATVRQPKPAITPAHRFERSDTVSRPQPLKKGGGAKRH